MKVALEALRGSTGNGAGCSRSTRGHSRHDHLLDIEKAAPNGAASPVRRILRHGLSRHARCSFAAAFPRRLPAAGIRSQVIGGYEVAWGIVVKRRNVGLADKLDKFESLLGFQLDRVGFLGVDEQELFLFDLVTARKPL